MDALADRGRQARQPLDFSALAWKDILWRVYTEINQDRILLVSAGSTFYLLLALFPFLAAFVSLYGFVADPKTIAEHIAFLGGLHAERRHGPDPRPAAGADPAGPRGARSSAFFSGWPLPCGAPTAG